MTYSELAKPGVLQQPVYEPGKPIDLVAREFGLDPAGVAKLASNENPLGASPLALEAARRALESVALYPDGGGVRLCAALAGQRGVEPGQIVLGNGSNEILELLAHVFLGPGDEAVMGTPAFVVYQLVTRLFGARPVEVPLVDHTHDLDAMLAAVTPRTRLVFLPSPNNPTGTANRGADIRAFVRALPDHVIFVFDEAYAEYLDDPPDLRELFTDHKVICLRTFSKIFGLAGLRIGYGYGPIELIALLNRVRQPFNVNAVAQAAALAALQDADWVRNCRAANRDGLDFLQRELGNFGLEVVPSRANFVLVGVPDAPAWFARLQRRGIIVRPMGGYGLANYLRISVGTPGQNRRLVEEVAALLATPSASTS